MKRKLIAMLFAGLLALGVTACGDDSNEDGDDMGTTTTTTTLLPPTTLP